MASSVNILEKIRGKIIGIWKNVLFSFRKIFFNKQDFERSLEVLKITEKECNGQNPFEVVLRFKGCGEYASIAPKQAPSEIQALYGIVREMRPKVVCEIGTYKGGTLYLWCKASSPDAQIISCDLPQGLRNAFSENRRRFYRHFSHNGQRMQFFPGDSHSRMIRESVEKALGGQKIDFLFIDGDHRLQGVKADFDNFASLVRKDGIIAFHDIFPRPEFPEIEVYKFWNDVKKSSRHTQEIKAMEGERPIGIGVLWKE